MLRKEVTAPPLRVAEMEGHRLLPPPQISDVLRHLGVGIGRKKKFYCLLCSDLKRLIQRGHQRGMGRREWNQQH